MPPSGVRLPVPLSLTPPVVRPLDGLQGTIASKQHGFESLLGELVAKACIDVCPKKPSNFSVENVRVAKVTRRCAHLVCHAVTPHAPCAWRPDTSFD